MCSIEMLAARMVLFNVWTVAWVGWIQLTTIIIVHHLQALQTRSKTQRHPAH